MLKTDYSFLLFLAVLCFSCWSNNLFAQEADVLMTNSKKIDEDRYKGVKGSPYLFDDWRKGKIISVDADVIDGLLLNFNGETNGFEIKKDDRFIELDPKWYIRVVVEGDEDEEIVFQRNFNPPLTNIFTRQIFKGKKITVVESFTSKIETKVINNVGKNEELKKFYSKTQYYLIRDKKPSSFKLKKKSLLSLLGHKAELEQFLKKEKVKLNNEDSLVKLLKFYEERDF